MKLSFELLGLCHALCRACATKTHERRDHGTLDMSKNQTTSLTECGGLSCHVDGDTTKKNFRRHGVFIFRGGQKFNVSPKIGDDY